MRDTAPPNAATSPITPELVAAHATSLGELAVDGDDVYWVELRPEESGRGVLMRHRNGKTRPVLPETVSVRTRVHEYGGGAVRAQNGTVVFSNVVDSGLYRLTENDAAPVQLCQRPSLRFADFSIDTTRSR